MATLTITSVTPSTGAVPGQKLALVGTGFSTTDYFLIGNVQALISSTPAPTDTAVTLVIPPGSPVGATTVRGIQGTTVVSQAVTLAAAPTIDTIVTSLAKTWGLDVWNGSAFLRCHGVTNFQPVVDSTMQDDSDYDSGVWGSDVRTQLKWSLTGKIKRGPGAITGAYDPAQEVLYAAHDQVGPAGVVPVRWFERIPNIGKAYSGNCYVGWAPDGGGTTDLETVSLTLNGVGARIPIGRVASMDA